PSRTRMRRCDYLSFLMNFWLSIRDRHPRNRFIGERQRPATAFESDSSSKLTSAARYRSLFLRNQETAMPPDGTMSIAQNPADLRAKVKAQVTNAKPSFFKLEAQLPRQGRTDTPVASSDKMWVVLKTYAADGENGLHAHPN